MDFFLTLLVGGLLSGPVYALVGAAFIVVYRASQVMNFSLGEWVSLGARTTGVQILLADDKSTNSIRHHRYWGPKLLAVQLIAECEHAVADHFRFQSS